MSKAISQLLCPLCTEPLMNQADNVVCPNGHSFDRARQGYLNLLPVQFKASRQPGDHPDMVNARRSFLSRGHYQPIADFLGKAAEQMDCKVWLDIGCGEGYYTAALATKLTDSVAYGLDISKDAVKRACARNRQINWLVASMARIPLADASCDLLTSLFSPLDWVEAGRVLVKGGEVLHISPCQRHLYELRELVYPDVRRYDDAKHLQGLPATFKLAETSYLHYQLELPESDDRISLLDMTPHARRCSSDARLRVAQELATVTVEVRLDRIIKG